MAVVSSASIPDLRHVAVGNAAQHGTMSIGRSEGLRSGPLTRENLAALPNNGNAATLPSRYRSQTVTQMDFRRGGALAGPALARIATMDSCRASILTDSTEFSTSSTINRGYAARIDVNGKVKPLSSTPDRHACQTIAFLEGPSDSLDYKTYRPGDEIKGAVHLLRNDPERGIITGIKARIRGDLETSVFGVGDSSYYSMDNEHGIARRQIQFFSEQKTLVTKADLESGAFELNQTGLVDHGRRNNLAVPFSFVLPLKLHASAIDMLDSKLKKTFKQGKKYIDLPPSIDMETRYAPPKPNQLFGQVKDKLHGQKLRPMARIKYEIDIIVSRQRFGSVLLPHRRGERIILAFAVEPYPPRTAGLAVPTLEPIRARRVTSRGERGVSSDRNASNDSAAVRSDGDQEEETVDEDSWASDLGGFRPTQEVFGALPLEAAPAFGPSSIARSISRPGLPGCRRKSYINVKEGVDGRMKGWLTHSLESTLRDGCGSFEAILSVPAMAALYMETKIPFSLELRMPQHLVGSYEPRVELALVRSVMTYSRLGTLVIEKEDPDNLTSFSGPHSWSERIRMVNMERQADTHLPPFYEQGQARQIYTGNFAIGRYEKMIKAGSSAPLKQKLIQEPELRLVVPSFSFKALRIEYRLRVKISLPAGGVPLASTSASTAAAAAASTDEYLVMETPPVHVAANPDTVDFTRQPLGESLDDDSLSTVDVLDEDDERMLEASAARIMRRPATPPIFPPAAVDDDEDEADFSAQATPLARTPRRRSLDLTALTNLTSTTPVQNDSLISSAASIISNSSSAALEVPSLDPIPDEADVDDEDELTEQLALGLIDREHAAAVVAARSRRRAAAITSASQQPTQALPSYSDSIGILG